MTSRGADQLRAAGLKATAGRLALLEVLEESPHSKAETLYQAIQGSRPTMSVQSVHNMLGDLTAAGIIRRIEPAGFAAMYELRVGDHHHHLVCMSCGALTDVDTVFGPAPCLDPVNMSGFVIDDAEVTFWGFCSSCKLQ